jgi:hypothetical protein
MNIGDLTKPVTTLIEKVSDFTGAALLPYQIKRVASAEIEVKKLQAIADLEISEIQQRGLVRLLKEEGRNQENIENIVVGALPEIKENAKPEEIEDDWLVNFFDKAKRFSDVEMQSLWSKILAGEANKVGSFSKRTIEIVSALDKEDAHLFTKLCSYIWKIGENDIPLIYHSSLLEPREDTEIYEDNGLDYDNLIHLDAIGLIKFQGLNTLAVNLDSKIEVCSYFESQVFVESIKEDNSHIKIGNVVLTKTGEQLAPICGAEKVKGFLDYTLKKWQDLGYITSSPFPKVKK